MLGAAWRAFANAGRSSRKPRNADPMIPCWLVWCYSCPRREASLETLEHVGPINPEQEEKPLGTMSCRKSSGRSRSPTAASRRTSRPRMPSSSHERSWLSDESAHRAEVLGMRGLWEGRGAARRLRRPLRPLLPLCRQWEGAGHGSLSGVYSNRGLLPAMQRSGMDQGTGTPRHLLSTLECRRDTDDGVL